MHLGTAAHELSGTAAAVYCYLMALIKVFGHTSPDTDTTGSAILLAWYLQASGKEAQPFVLGDLNKETAFVLSRWGVEKPALLAGVAEGDTVAIVDTNNKEELFENINDATIAMIVDHHLLTGTLKTKAPLEITMKPLACTATLIYDLMGAHAAAMPAALKGIMLSCILSDTLEFRSPTTTGHDRDVAEQLAKDLGIAIPAYAAELFAAKSDVSDFTDAQLLALDSKVFEVGDRKIRISVVETTNPTQILARKDGLVAAIDALLKGEPATNDVLFFVIDILQEEATVFTYNDFTKQLVAASFGATVSGETVVLPGVVSRKKQIVPKLTLPQA